MLRKKFFNLSITTMVVMLLNWTLTILLPYKGIPIFPYSNISVSEKKSIIISVLLNSGSYDSLLNMIFLVLVYLLSLNYLLSSFEAFYIVRFKSKLCFLKHNFMICTIFTLLFVFIKTLVGIICSSALFGQENLKHLSYYRIELVNSILPILFYSLNGLILISFNYIIGKKYSVIFIFLLNLFEYALIKLNIVTWIFIKDATKFSMFLSGKITYSIFISTIFRSILYIIIVSCLGNYLVCNKDNFINEKK